MKEVKNVLEMRDYKGEIKKVTTAWEFDFATEEEVVASRDHRNRDGWEVRPEVDRHTARSGNANNVEIRNSLSNLP